MTCRPKFDSTERFSILKSIPVISSLVIKLTWVFKCPEFNNYFPSLVISPSYITLVFEYSFLIYLQNFEIVCHVSNITNIGAFLIIKF